MLTGSMFRETLPLLAAELDAASSSGKDHSAQIIQEVNSLQEGSQPPTTNFEDYRHNMLSGAMDVAASSFVSQTDKDGAANKMISTGQDLGEVNPMHLSSKLSIKIFQGNESPYLREQGTEMSKRSLMLSPQPLSRTLSPGLGQSPVSPSH